MLPAAVRWWARLGRGRKSRRRWSNPGGWAVLTCNVAVGIPVVNDHDDVVQFAKEQGSAVMYHSGVVQPGVMHVHAVLALRGRHVITYQGVLVIQSAVQHVVERWCRHVSRIRVAVGQQSGMWRERLGDMCSRIRRSWSAVKHVGTVTLARISVTFKHHSSKWWGRSWCMFHVSDGPGLMSGM